jgi:hypothetical protein
MFVQQAGCIANQSFVGCHQIFVPLGINRKDLKAIEFATVVNPRRLVEFALQVDYTGFDAILT